MPGSQQDKAKMNAASNPARRRLLICFATAASVLLAATGAVRAQEYPSRVIKIIVPFTPGGAVDVVARIVAPKLSEALGQPVIIENRGGAGGVLGATAVAQAAPDGYTLLVGTVSTQGTNSAVYTKLSYDPVRDFAPIVLLSMSPLVMEVKPSLPVKNVTEFIALARASPGKITYGSYGVGSINHLVSELFNSMAGIQTRHVPYRGSAPMLQELIRGPDDYVFERGGTPARRGDGRQPPR